MNYTVVLAPEARDDLIQIYQYVAENDSVINADKLLEKIEKRCMSLGSNPQHGHVVPELERLYVNEFRENHCKPYRIIFRLVDENVYIYAVLDGRRELQDFLEMRLLRKM